MQLECFARTETGRVRPSNQDAVGCFPEIGLFAVADGMGGHEAGEVASQMAVEGLRVFYGRDHAGGHAERLIQAISFSNHRIFLAGHPQGRMAVRPMGTTLVALSVTAPAVTWAHVGDSRLYRLREGQLELLTADHTRYGGRFSDRRDIPLDLPHTNELLAALGIEPAVSPDSGTEPWRTGDVYLLCSDGISGLVPAGWIRHELSQPSPVDAIGSRLIERALESGGNDNASVVLVRVAD